MRPLSLDDIRQMTPETLRRLWDLAYSVCWRQRYRFTPAQWDDVVQQGIIALFTQVVNGARPVHPEKYFGKIVCNLASQALRPRREVPGLDRVQHLADEVADNDLNQRRYRLLNDTFDLMRADGQGACVELLLDSYTTPQTDRELAEQYGWKVDFVRTKRQRCKGHFLRRAAEHPDYDALFGDER